MADYDKLKAEIDKEMSKFEGTDKEVEKEVDNITEEVHSAESEEVVNEVQEVSDNESIYSDVEKEAISMGWDPKRSGPGAKTAEQFVKDGSFFKKIDAQKKEIQDLKHLMQQQIEHTRKVELAAQKAKLEAVKQEALEKVAEGDVEGFKIAQQKELVIQEQINQIQPVQKAPEIPQEFLEFAKKNADWFNKNTPENARMADAADALYALSEREAAESGVAKTVSQHLEYVEKNLSEMPAFKHRFPKENPNLKKPSLVAKSSVGGSGDVSGLASKLSERQRDYLKQAKRYGLNITAEEYAKQLQMTGELRDE